VTRVITGVILAGLVAAAAWWAPPLPLLAIAMAVAAFGAHEFARLASALGAPVHGGSVAVAAAAVCAMTAWPWAYAGTVTTPILAAAALPVFSAIVLAFGVAAVRRASIAPDVLARVASAVFGAFYLGLPLGAVIAVRGLAGREAMLLLLVVVVASDTAQYYTGRLFGRRKLALVLSPGKTLEGALGGIVFGAAALAVVGAWWWPQASTAFRLVTGGALAVLGICGDLFESMLKRAAGVKDSATLLPGHGGVLDRIDALLFAAPVYFGAMFLTHLA
jgi:phosphatidate cytidylyltransferase